MNDKIEMEVNWYSLPEYVDVERLTAILPASITRVFRFRYNRSDIICITLSNIPIVFSIAETPAGRFISGLDNLLPMGKDSLRKFLQLYWRYFFEDTLGDAGYNLKISKANSNNGSLSLFFFKGKEVVYE